MKNYIILFIITSAVLMSGCDMSDYTLPEPDGRLLGVDVVLKHKDPRSGETLTNVFENFFRKDDNVEIEISSTKAIDKIDVVNSVVGQVIATIPVNGTSTSFEYLVDDMEIPFGQSGNLVFHLYYADSGEEGFDYPSIQSYAFSVISDIPSIINFRKSDGSLTELRANDVNISRYFEDESKGVVAEFKGGESSYLDVNDNALLHFGADKNFAVSFWVQSDHDISDPAMMGTMDWNSSGNKGWVIAWRNGRLRIVAGDGEGTKIDYSQDSGDPSMVGPDWHFVVVNFNRTGQSELYIDGELKGSADMEPVDIDNGVTVKINQDGTGDYGDKLRANYSQIVFYNYVLSSDQVTDIYNDTK